MVVPTAPDASATASSSKWAPPLQTTWQLLGALTAEHRDPRARAADASGTSRSLVARHPVHQAGGKPASPGGLRTPCIEFAEAFGFDPDENAGAQTNSAVQAIVGHRPEWQSHGRVRRGPRAVAPWGSDAIVV